MFARKAVQNPTLSFSTPTPCGFLVERHSRLILASDNAALRLQGVPVYHGLRDKCRNSLWRNKSCEPVFSEAPDNAHKSAFGEASRAEDEFQNFCERGLLDKALDVLRQMDEKGYVPSLSLYRSFLKACTRRGAPQAKKLHAHLVRRGLETESCIGEDLVSTLAKCGCLEDAVQVFNRLAEKTVFSWTAVISGYAAVGQGKEALQIYDLMLGEGLKPNRHTIVALLKACRSDSDHNNVKRIHADALKHGCGYDLVVGTCLVDMYAKCGSIQDAKNVFDKLVRRDVVSWTAMFSAYVQQGQPERALELYVQMLVEGGTPDNRTFVIMLQACGVVADKCGNHGPAGPWTAVKLLEMGKSAHASAWRQGYESDVFINNTLISMYGKCGSIDDAQQVFKDLVKPNVVPWNAMMAAYAHQGETELALQLYEQILEEGVTPDDRTFVSLLQACALLADEEEGTELDGRLTKVKTLFRGKTIQASILQHGCGSDVFVGNALVTMYSKCGCIVDAQLVFDGLSERDVVSWNGTITAYAQQGHPEKSLQVFELMLKEGLVPTVPTYLAALQACGMLAEREESSPVDVQLYKVDCLVRGKKMHAYIWTQGHDHDVVVGNILISVYVKCGSIEDAQTVFNRLPEQNVVAWTALLSGYVQQGEVDKALQLYSQMRASGQNGDCLTFLCLLQACSLRADKEEEVLNGTLIKPTSLALGKAIHADVWKQCYNLDCFIGSALISMYGKCGSILDAELTFKSFPWRRIGIWNAMLSAYVEQAQGGRALHLFRQMKEEGVSPDEITIVCILQACSRVGSLIFSRQVYHFLATTGKGVSTALGNTLIHALGNCYSMSDAQSVFNALRQPDVISWTALIAGYAREGNYVASLQKFEAMKLAGITPNAVTYLALLSACTHSGLVHQGVEYFESMITDHDITPQIEHYSSMVDLLGRAGHFKAILHLLRTMPMPPDLTLWVCLLSACQKHGKVAVGKLAFDGAFRLQPKHPAAYVLMSNIFSNAGLWERAKEVKDLRHANGAWKEPGQSWIDHCHETHTFVVEDYRHPERERLYQMLDAIERKKGCVGLKCKPQN